MYNIDFIPADKPMTAQILDGTAIAANIKADIAAKITERKKNHLSTPGLAVILIGDNDASQTYVNHKRRACEAVGIYSECHALPEKIDPKKDVDGFHPYNLGRLAQKRPLLRSCTPFGVMTLLKATGENLAGKHAVVVGASNIVGRPMALELLLEKCTVTVCHRLTRNLQQFIQQADILISATGNYGAIKSEWIKPGAIVIDVGFSRLSNGKNQ